MKIKILISLIVLIVLVGGFFIYKNFFVHEVEISSIVKERLDCPFECCIDEIYKFKACPTGYECQENVCIGLKEEQPSAVEFKFVRKIEIAEGVYPNIIFTKDHFYIAYYNLDAVVVKVYDKNFNFIGKEHRLKGARADFQMVYGEGYFYLFDPLYLRKFDENFNQIKLVSVSDNLPAEVAQAWPHGIDDMLLYYHAGTLYLGIAVGDVPPWSEEMKDKKEKPDIPDNLYIQKYNQNLGLENEIMLKDVGNTPGSSMIFQNGIFTIVTSDRHWDDSSLIVVRYDANWNFIDSKTISAISGANEEFPMGVLFENGLYFVCYQHITGDLSQPIVGEPIRRVDVMLDVFASDWNLLDQTIVTDDISASALTGHTRAPHLALAENKIYVSYGIDKIFVKEYEIIYE